MVILAAMPRAGKLALLVAALGLVAVVAVVSAPGCASSAGESDEPSSVERKERRGRGREKDPDPVSEKGKQWGGWRWKGARADCVYLHDNECFADRKAACRAAGCGESSCRDKGDSAPIKVRCKAK